MKTAVLVCRDRAPTLHEHDLPDGPEAHVVPDLCRTPRAIGELAVGYDRLVVGVCPGEYSLGAIQAQARRLGIDGLGVELVDLGSAGGHAERLRLVLAAAAARAQEFPGSQAEQAKLTVPRTRSRRSLFTLPRPGYLAAPAVNSDLCQAATGCSACVSACPRGALSWADGKVTLDVAACEPCSLCVTACPVDALVDPSATPAMIEAQVRRLVDPPIGPPGSRGIVFSCRRATRSEPVAGWYPVTVPCAGVVPPTWLLAPLLLGAAATAIRPCGESGCPLGNDARASEVVGFCREFLGQLSLGAEHVTLHADEPPSGLDVFPADRRGHEKVDRPFTASASGRVLVQFGEMAHMPPGVSFGHPTSPVGVVTIRADVCTGCGMCAEACPTGALRRVATEGGVEVRFDSAVCRACGQCLPRCPEAARGALILRREVDFESLVAGHQTLFSGATVRCASCGGPVMPAKLVDRIAELCGPEQSATVHFVSRYCLECRARPASFAPSPSQRREKS